MQHLFLSWSGSVYPLLKLHFQVAILLQCAVLVIVPCSVEEHVGEQSIASLKASEGERGCETGFTLSEGAHCSFVLRGAGRKDTRLVRSVWTASFSVWGGFLPSLLTAFAFRRTLAWLAEDLKGHNTFLPAILRVHDPPPPRLAQGVPRSGPGLAHFVVGISHCPSSQEYCITRTTMQQLIDGMNWKRDETTTPKTRSRKSALPRAPCCFTARPHCFQAASVSILGRVTSDSPIPQASAGMYVCMYVHTRSCYLGQVCPFQMLLSGPSWFLCKVCVCLWKRNRNSGLSTFL